MNERRKNVVLTVYPEGTRSKTGKLRRRGRPGIGWVQHQTGVAIVPIYHTGGLGLPGLLLGQKLKIRIGKPIRFDHYADAPNDVMTWRGITEEVMDALREMERDEKGEGFNVPAVRTPRRASRSSRSAASSQSPAQVG